MNDLNLVNLVGTHTYISDLTFRITSPSGTVVTLFDKICTTEENFDVNFDDEAAPGALPCPPTGGGNYQSAGLLSAFDGENMNGTWTLSVIDNFDIDGGSLDSWGLNICFTPTTPCTNPTAATISGTTAICPGGSTTLSVATGTLNDATNWQWYTGSCGGTSAGSGTSITASAAGTYFVRGEGGCVTAGTCQSIVVTQTAINTNTSLTAGVLSSNQNGATYQWLDCGNANAPIAGATNQTFTPTVNGSYSVRVTFSGCTATSNCVTYNSVGLLDLTDGAIQLYPNPTTGIVTVSFGQEVAIEAMNITDVTGRIVREDNAFKASSVEIDITKESKGIYFLNIQVGGQLQTLKITKN